MIARELYAQMNVSKRAHTRARRKDSLIKYCVMHPLLIAIRLKLTTSLSLFLSLSGYFFFNTHRAYLYAHISLSILLLSRSLPLNTV